MSNRDWEPPGRPVTHGAEQPYGYTGSDDSVYKANSRQNRLPSKKEKKKNIKWTEKITDLWISLKGQFKQEYWRLPSRGLSMGDSSNG